MAEVPVLVTCHYGGYSIVLNQPSGQRLCSFLVTDIISYLFASSDERDQKSRDIRSILVNRIKIYTLEENISLSTGDVVVLLTREPLNTPIPPQADESIGVRVYDIDLTAEEMIVRSTLDEIPELHYLRKNTIPIVDDKLKEYGKDFAFPENLLPSLFEVSPRCTRSYMEKLQQLLRKGAKFQQQFLDFFRMARAEFFWHAHLYLPLLNKFSLHGLLSGETKLGQRTPAIQPKTRQLFFDGIFPDLCDGWLYKLQAKQADFLLRSPYGETIYLSKIDGLYSDCGDANILLLDFFGKLHADRAKLLLQMGQSARQFASTVRQFPLIFGLTCDASIVNAYAVRARALGSSASSTIKEIAKNSSTSTARLRSQGSVEKKTEIKVSLSKEFKQATETAMADFEAPKALRRSTQSNKDASTSQSSSSYSRARSNTVEVADQRRMSSGRARSNSPEKSLRASILQQDVHPIDIYHLWTLNMNDPTHHVLLAGYLAKIYEIRLQQFNSWFATANLNWEKPGRQSQKIEENSDSTNNTNQQKPSSSGKSSSKSDSYGQNNRGRPSDALIKLLSKWGFMPTSGYNLGGGNTFAFRGTMMDTGYAAIMKGFSDFDDFQAELGVYMHLEYFKFQYMPKLYKYGCTEEQIYIAVEDLGDEPLKLTTKDDFKRFAFDLIKAVQELHSARVIHGDLKPSNLRYLKEKRIVKLFDFNYSSVIRNTDQCARCFGYTHGYVSPEVLSTNQVMQIDDMFSVGMILASLVFDFKPKNDDDYKLVCRKIDANEEAPLVDRPMLELIGRLLKPEEERISAAQALQAGVFDTEESISSGDEEMHLD